jgi:uncharacterized membrane protein YfcA
MDYTPVQLALAALSGGLVALLLTVFGGGGSVLAVPLLLYMVGVREPHAAVGASAAGVALNALTALAGHARAGRVRWGPALGFAVFGVAGAWAGASLAQRIDGRALLLAFAGAMAAVGLAMLRPVSAGAAAERRPNRALTPRLAGAGLGVGAASGFFGIGGGFLIVPGLMAATGMGLALAQAASLVSVAAFGATTAATYAAGGWLDPALVAAMALGGLAGAAVGLPLAARLGRNAALGRRLFAGLIVLTAGYVAIRALSGG